MDFGLSRPRQKTQSGDPASPFSRSRAVSILYLCLDYTTFRAKKQVKKTACGNVQNFVTAYKDAYGTEPENAFAALGYDAMDLIGQALATVDDPTDTAAIREALENTKDFKGVTGTISYTAESHKPDKTASILELVDGKFQFITEE